jgi:transposase
MDVQPRLLLEELKQLERAEKDAGKSKRLRIVILAMEGWTALAVAVGLSRRVCQHWVYRFNEQGLAGLEDHRGRQPTSPLTSEQEEAIRRRIDGGPTAQDGICSLRGADIRRFLQPEFGLLRSLAGVYHLLHRRGYSYLRPRPRHRKADPEAVDAFRQAWPERLPTIAAEHPGKRLLVYFQDESRFGQQGTTTQVWAKKGSRPPVVRQTEYEYLWVLGTVCPETGHPEGLLSPQLNANIVNIFLEQFSKTVPDDVQAVMLWDGAGFHTSQQLHVPKNVTLIKLPA